MPKKIFTDFDFQNAGRVTNILDGVNPQDAASVAQVRAVQEQLSPKDNVRVASTGNINLASPGASIDGVTMASGQAFLAKDQTSQAENGIYIWNGASAQATRRFDVDAGSELLSAVVTVDEGVANAGTTWRQGSIAIVIGTTAITWFPFGVVSPPSSTTTPGNIQIATQSEVDAGVVTNKSVTPFTLASTPKVKKVSVSVGDGSANQFDVTHNLNSLDCVVNVYRNSTPFDTIECDVERPSVNIVRVRFSVAPAAGAYRVVVIA